MLILLYCDISFNFAINPPQPIFIKVAITTTNTNPIAIKRRCHVQLTVIIIEVQFVIYGDVFYRDDVRPSDYAGWREIVVHPLAHFVVDVEARTAVDCFAGRNGGLLSLYNCNI